MVNGGTTLGVDPSDLVTFVTPTFGGFGIPPGIIGAGVGAALGGASAVLEEPADLGVLTVKWNEQFDFAWAGYWDAYEAQQAALEKAQSMIGAFAQQGIYLVPMFGKNTVGANDLTVEEVEDWLGLADWNFSARFQIAGFSPEMEEASGNADALLAQINGQRLMAGEPELSTSSVFIVGSLATTNPGTLAAYAMISIAVLWGVSVTVESITVSLSAASTALIRETSDLFEENPWLRDVLIGLAVAAVVYSASRLK